MKKLFFILALSTITTLSGFAQGFQARSFLNGSILSVTITNAASAPLGGFTNINSFISATGGTVGTNALSLMWTNSAGIRVIPTNSTPSSSASTSLVTNDSTSLFLDIPLFTDREGRIPTMVVSNDFASFLSGCTISATVKGGASAATTLNLLFVGLPDGVNEVTAANGTPMTFQWGFVPASGITTLVTNFPAWRFAGCSKIRLRSATLSTATAANIDATILALSFNGFPP